MSALTRELEPTAVTGDTRELVPYVLERCVGKNDTEIRNALVKALRRFCKESKAWREALIQLDTDEASPGYLYAAPGFGEIETVCEVRGPGIYRCPPPDYACEDGRDVVFDYPIPSGSVPYAAMVPSRGDDHAPARIFRKWGEAICNGALHELAANGQQNAATSWKALYDNAVTEALLDQQTRVNGTLRADANVEVI
jgi:hypothetical protein